MVTLFSSTKVIFTFLVDFLEKQGFTIFQNVLLSAIHLTFRMFEIFFSFFNPTNAEISLFIVSVDVSGSL